MSTPAVRRLRNAIEKRMRQLKKGKLFGNKRAKVVSISAFNSGNDSCAAIIDSTAPGTSSLPSLIAKEEVCFL